MRQIEAKSYLVGYIEINGRLYSGEPGIVDRVVDDVEIHGAPSFSVSFRFGGGSGQNTPPIWSDTPKGKRIIGNIKFAFGVADIQDIVGKQAFALRPYTNPASPYNETIVGIVPASDVGGYTLIDE